MKTAKNIALILMCVTLIATVVVGGILLSRVLDLLLPAAPTTDDSLQASSSSESVPSTPATTLPTVPPTSSTAPIHQCDFTIKGKSYDPTCDMMGYTEYACECGKVDYQDYIPSLGHIYGDYIVVPPTCSVDGWTERSCSRCKQCEKSDFVDAAHTFTDWTATELQNRESRTCSACGLQELRSTVSGEDWKIQVQQLENAGNFGHLQVTFKPTKKADSEEHHIYVGFEDANIRFDSLEGYLVIYYTFNGEEKANVILSNLKNLTLQPIGDLVSGKPGAAS